MNRITVSFIALTLGMLNACNESVVEPEPLEPQGSLTLIKNLPADTANTGHFTFFRLADSSFVAFTDSATTTWDIAFRSTTILVNGGTSGPGQAGALLLTDTDFDTLSTAPASGYVSDGTSKAITGWYTYTGEAPTPPKHAIIPKAGTVIVLRSADGKYAKVQIQHYYKDAPDPLPTDAVAGTPSVPARYYTFRYFYQPNGSRALR